MKAKKNAWLISGVRTPIGSFGKSLRSVTVDKLAAHVIKGALRRSHVNPSMLDAVIMGHGYQSSYTPNTGRVSAQLAGVPDSVPAVTVQRQCGSGMEAANNAAEKIWLGKADLVLAVGAESMSTIPYQMPGNLRWEGPVVKWLSKWIKPQGPRPVIGLADNGLAPLKLIWDMKTVYMSGTAQRLANTYQIARADADAYAFRSQELAHRAITSGRFDVEIEPIETGRGFFSRDEHARGVKSEQNPGGTTIEKLNSLGGVLKTQDITAGNSSGINDGACALMIASDEKVAELGVEPLALLVDHAVAGVDHEQMGIGPVEAINKLLAANNLTIADIDLIEINEAFAAQYLACEKLLGLDRNKVNVNGGAIALGHPIGMSGARVLLTLAHELKRQGKKRGIAALCIGGGMGIATLIENPSV
jgi:acetyl-CoA C-acetyltransferase